MHTTREYAYNTTPSTRVVVPLRLVVCILRHVLLLKEYELVTYLVGDTLRVVQYYLY